MGQKKFWTLPKKIAFTIALAILIWALFGCARSIHVDESVGSADTDAAFLQREYASYNDQLFGNHLTKTPKIDTDLHSDSMADTTCVNDGTNCTLSFNLHYVAAPRIADIVLLHEMCHIKLWSKHMPPPGESPNSGSEFYHDRSWRACMLSLDLNGAFRNINIDYYHEGAS